MQSTLRNWKFAAIAFTVLWLSGCAIDHKKLIQLNQPPKKLTIFFDGTNNDEETDTNVKKLHSLITLQKRNDIAALYIEGVGADSKVIGMATGWGIGDRVKMAYQFLIENYQLNDQIYIFGFSRGAYSGRILASLLNSAGIPFKHDKNLSAEEIAEDIYSSFKGDISHQTRIQKIQDTYQKLKLPPITPVFVDVLGLWDTVEALGWPDYEANVDIPNPRYEDQLCNVKKAFHAMSIDDDRERIFTPILLTRRHLVDNCRNKNIADFVDEVWFAGAHMDVGGGYADSLSGGVSLNWMIQKLQAVSDILPANASVPENRFEASHDPESGVWGLIYHQQYRALHRYMETSVCSVNRIKLHRSVIQRLENTQPNDHEYPWMDTTAQDERNEGFLQCFEKTDCGYRYIGYDLPNCPEIVD